MPPCDCSNCLPEEAEAIWLAQQSLTVDNFDEALTYSELDLNQLCIQLPKRPLDPEVTPACEALRCSAKDPIRQRQPLQTLVDKWIEVFNIAFYSVYPATSDLGPWDFFGVELAWDLAKNIDILAKASDLTLILTSETVQGQLESLFGAFESWKGNSGSDEEIAKAAKFRNSLKRTAPLFKPPISIEGLELFKKREATEKDTAKKAKAAKKEAIQRGKAEAAAAKKLRIQQQAEERSQLAAFRKQSREARPLASKSACKTHGEGSGGPRKRAASSLAQPTNMKRVVFEGGYKPLYFLLMKSIFVFGTHVYPSSGQPSAPSSSYPVDKPQRNRDRPAAESAWSIVIMLYSPVLKAFVAKELVSLSDLFVRWSLAYRRKLAMDAGVILLALG
ncbi:uncharacterized protein MELLADRAFT_70260 [Melampsora larici-populina 98AG31]|uniref:Uncharacterized protein n=1 Tax=Melampsora larici-populina (strain 98AG31 / pathotype 3-4-7) TaxID=747676 RepID=F4SE93_MELLP|nr:uncharacterized protein MELLADRAFT_70260 [Melampsora larici-populina 98AG31]EGF97033.1 hypothetical protein MELLADRAFT_70260 [Melampsora larici-populina 98AG31]